MATITDIVQQKYNQKRYSLFVDGTFFSSASDYIIVKYKLKKGICINRESLKQVCFEDSLERAKNYILRYHLGKSRFKILQKLQEKGYEDDVIAALLEFLLQQQFLDDTKTAVQYKETALQSKQYGKRKILHQLRCKGYGEEQVQQISSQFTFEEEVLAANKLLEKKKDRILAKSKNPFDWKRRISALLQSRGYSMGVISNILASLQDGSFE